MRIAVAGGTGTIGAHVVDQARRAGHDPVVLTRSTGVDLVTGEGLDAALAGADAVVDAVSVTTTDPAAAAEFFETATGNLLDATVRAGVRHAVVVSIIGIDRNPHGYYAGKLAQERAVEESDAPWTIIRGAQFHEFAGQIAARAKIAGLQLAPRARTQPVSAATFAEHLVRTAEGAPAGRAQDVAGPREEELSRMIRALLRHDGRRGPIIPVSAGGRQMAGMRAGLGLPGPDALLLGPTFDDWLAAR